MNNLYTTLNRWIAAPLSTAMLGLFGLAQAAEPPAVGSNAAASSAPSAAPAPVSDETALAALNKVQVAMLGLKTYKAECWTTIIQDPSPDGKPRPNSYEMATLTAVKPNLMRYDEWTMKVDPANAWTRKKETPELTFVCDGKTNWRQYGTNYRTDKRTEPKGLSTILEPWTGFYAADWSPYGEAQYYKTHGSLIEAKDTGSESVEGVACGKVFIHSKVDYEGTAQEYWTTWYIGPDNLVRRKVEHVTFGGKGGYVRDATLRAIKTNDPVALNSGLFTYKAPKGVELESDTARKQPPLLANGTSAPNFTAVDKNGKSVTLASLKGKVVVIDFWASWCPPCKASMPHNQEVAKKLQAAGVPVVLLAVDNSEDRDAFAAWVTDHPELSSLSFAYVDPKTTDLCNKTYQVSGIPTQYILDAKGVIRASFVGFGGPTDDLENAIRSALKN